MELREIGMADLNWVTRIGLMWCMAVGLTGLLYLATRNPWAGVFACGAGLGWVLTDYMLACADVRARREEVAELEKQVVVLRSTLQDMAVMHEDLQSRVTEAEYLRARSRLRGMHSRSSTSL